MCLMVCNVKYIVSKVSDTTTIIQGKVRRNKDRKTSTTTILRYGASTSIVYTQS